MTYPQFKNKHLEEALFHPDDYIDYKKWDKKTFPKKFIFVYGDEALEYFKSNFKINEKIKLHSLITIYKHGDIGFVKMSGIGCPNAVTVLEELVALGGKIFLSIGTVGGLQNKGIFLCQKALRDEGTSFHYVPHGKFSYPDESLTKKLGKVISKRELNYEDGTTWTIDAPYRETKAEIAKYKKIGISTVEMEASALFVVAKFRKVKIASAFVVSDILGDEWDPQFHTFDLKRNLHKLIDAGVECLK